jgi:hypothetical protein
VREQDDPTMGRLDRRVQELPEEEDGHDGTGLGGGLVMKIVASALAGWAGDCSVCWAGGLQEMGGKRIEFVGGRRRPGREEITSSLGERSSHMVETTLMFDVDVDIELRESGHADAYWFFLAGMQAKGGCH